MPGKRAASWDNSRSVAGAPSSINWLLAWRLPSATSPAIALALHLRADVLLMDEKLGRAAARQCGLIVAGALGELVHAKIAGWIPSVRDDILRLRREAGFFVDAGLEPFILSQVGE